jgi:S-formylglutathione hydrolase
MKFAAYIPPLAVQNQKLPVLYWLSGLTCSEEIFLTEASAQAYAKKNGVILVVPDTSPRNTGIPGEDETYDLGSGASFYVDATQKKWSKHYQMYSYITEELRQVAEGILPVDRDRRGIFGHSMGGHGALVLGMRNPKLYRSISAFAPICVPSKSPWGIKAFSEYLGPDQNTWAQYDANEILKKSGTQTPILIDQGLEDEYLGEQLYLNEFEKTMSSVRVPISLRKRSGYDHSYYFISTFIEDHIAFHASCLK